MKELIFNKVTKVFQQNNKEQLTVLEDINLKINKNEFLTLLGPSGCGKSTLLNLAAGFISPEQGEILFQNNKIKGPDKNRILVFQEDALFPWLSILDNVKFGLTLNGWKDKNADKKAKNMLNKVKLKGFFDSYPHQLSGGMKQRAALARALVMEPELILMDEPFGALDEQTRLLLQEELVELWQDIQNTVLFVTHNLHEALKLSDRIVILGTSPGRILKEYTINIPRPRNRQNNTLLSMEKEILSLLRKEMSKSTAHLREEKYNEEKTTTG